MVTFASGTLGYEIFVFAYDSFIAAAAAGAVALIAIAALVLVMVDVDRMTQ